MFHLAQINAGNPVVSTFAYIAILSLLFGFILYFLFSYRHKQRDYLLLQQQKRQIDEQKTQLETALQELKAAQAQLVHSEKMASLGMLTGGIAHEIQNPLNFVNNFSQTNSELIDELEQAAQEGRFDEARQLVKYIRENEEKIIHHGQRAEAIVKSMLQHSRRSTGAKEPTNINSLADEYLQLAYHGVRAKSKDFDVAMETVFDPSVGKIDIMPQEIGRVLLNLFNNAFYAVDEKKKSNKGFEPVVSVSTQRLGNNVEITIKDNGTGISQKNMDKIFQPFFTTKPTGEGTGLGLSMAYDIVKAHGGEIKVTTKENEGSEFTVLLPAVQQSY